MALAVDSEFDPFKQCFINDDVEFYGSAASPNSTTPSEDIWKKFDDMELEFFPTPPLSPSHPSSDGEDTGGGGGISAPLFADSDKLQRVLSEILEDEPVWMTQSLTFVGPDHKPTVPTTHRNASPARINIGSHKSNFLIQDCMWSAIQAEERRRQMQAEKAAKNGRLTAHSSVAGGVSGDFSSGECVDPTSVFPYPLSDTRLDFSSTTPSDSGEYFSFSFFFFGSLFFFCLHFSLHLLAFSFQYSVIIFEGAQTFTWGDFVFITVIVIN